MQISPKQQRDRVLQMMIVWFVLGAAILLALTYAGPETGEDYITDTGLVQMTTLMTLVIAAISAAALAVRHAGNRVNLALLACGLTIYAGREHDLHRLEFLPEHYTRWQFYVMPDVTIWQKLAFGAMMLLIITVISTFVVRMAKPALRDLKRAEPWAILGMAWFTTLVASQISDRTWLNDTFAGRAFEEVAEFVAGGIALLVVLYFPRIATTEEAAATEMTPQPAQANAA